MNHTQSMRPKLLGYHMNQSDFEGAERVGRESWELHGRPVQGASRVNSHFQEVLSVWCLRTNLGDIDVPTSTIQMTVIQVKQVKVR